MLPLRDFSYRDISLNTSGLLPHQRWCKLPKCSAGKGIVLAHFLESVLGSKLFLGSFLLEALQGQAQTWRGLGLWSHQGTGVGAWPTLSFRIREPVMAALLHYSQLCLF